MENKEKKGFHYAWVIVFVGFLLMFFISATFASCTSMLMKPVSEALGVSRSQYSLAITAASIAGMIMSTNVGKIYRKFTVKKTVLVGTLLFAICYLSFSMMTSIVVFYAFSFVMGFALTGATMLAISTLITRWFNEKNGLAIALASTGSGVGGIFMNPIVGKLITTVGWRKTYLTMAIMLTVVLVPAIIFLLKESPESMGLKPYGYKENKTPVSGEQTKPVSDGMVYAEAKKTSMFWSIVPLSVIVSVTCNCVMQHTVAYATDIGYGFETAAVFASVMTASLAIAKIIMGHLFDSMGTLKAGMLSLGIFTGCIVLYLFATNKIAFFVAVALFGFGASFATIADTVIVQEIFGKKDFATIFGKISFFKALGSAVGSPAIAAVYDNLGTYKPAWIILIGCLVLSIVLLNLVYANKKKYDAKNA